MGPGKNVMGPFTNIETIISYNKYEDNISKSREKNYMVLNLLLNLGFSIDLDQLEVPFRESPG